MPHINRTVRGLDGEPPPLVSRRILAYVSGYTVATIRKHIDPVACDLGSRAVLYDQDAAIDQLEALGVEPRPDRRGGRRPVRDARPGRVA